MSFIRRLRVLASYTSREAYVQRRVVLRQFIRGLAYGTGTAVAGVVTLWLRLRYGG
jgi:hypothetical protein